MIHNLEISPAEPSDAEEIEEIYCSLVGAPGCIWDDQYPTIDHVRHDIENGAAFKAVIDGRIVGAAYCGDYEEKELLKCFDGAEKLGEFGRVGVRREFHRMGVAEALLRYLKGNAKERGYDALSLLVARNNFGAMALYEKLGFKNVGESELYDMEWYCYLCKLLEDI